MLKTLSGMQEKSVKNVTFWKHHQVMQNSDQKDTLKIDSFSCIPLSVPLPGWEPTDVDDAPAPVC